jgi:hypothetical protein
MFAVSAAKYLAALADRYFEAQMQRAAVRIRASSRTFNGPSV